MTTEKNRGEIDFRHEGKPTFQLHDGMTLRDWFAGQVAVNHMQLNDHNINDYQARSTARWAYMVADAMLEARK